MLISMRAFAYPAEDPSSLYDVSSLTDYYLWMLSDFSNNTDKRYIEFNQV